MGRVILHPKYCSYFPLLFKAIKEVYGDVLELGAGLYSTPYLHWICFDQGRWLLTYENDEKYYQFVKGFQDDFHAIRFTTNWDDIVIDREFAIALVDHAPGIRRKEEVRRLADSARVIIIHDSQGRSGKHYRYEEIYPLFKYIVGDTRTLPHTTALSNFIDVTRWRK